MRQVFPFKDVNYGSSKDSATAEVATVPYDLREGALGIYGIDPGSANNANKLALITDGGSDAAGKVPAASFTGKEIVLALGKANGADQSVAIDLANCKLSTAVYVAPVKQVLTLGADGVASTKSMNLPSVISKNDEGILIVKDMNDEDSATEVGKSYSGYAPTDDADEYDILLDLVNRIDEDDERIIEADIVLKATPTYITNTADPTLVNGSKAITFAADPSLAAGDVIVIKGSAYKIESEQSATSYTLDRPYKGASETIDVSAGGNATAFGTLASVTDAGLKITDRYNEQATRVSVEGIFADAEKVTATEAKAGNGTSAKVKEAEEDARPAFGVHDNISRYVPLKDLETVDGETYDLYILHVDNDRPTSDPHSSKTSLKLDLLLAFPSAVADTGGKNQSNFEDIMTSLGVTVTSAW